MSIFERARHVLALALCMFMLNYGAPTGATACTGGLPFSAAVAQERGGIVRGVVQSRQLRADFSEDIVIRDSSVVRGDPPLRLNVIAAAGLPCEQVADRGETILLVYDIRDEPVHLPFYYVVGGADALTPAVVASALQPTAPPTDANPSTRSNQEASVDWLSFAVLTFAGAIGFAVAARRSNRGSLAP